MEITYNIASEQGNIAITRTDNHGEGRFVEWKQVAMRDGSFVGYTRTERNTKWKKDSWGKMAAKRFAWAKEAAEQYFSA